MDPLVQFLMDQGMTEDAAKAHVAALAQQRGNVDRERGAVDRLLSAQPDTPFAYGAQSPNDVYARDAANAARMKVQAMQQVAAQRPVTPLVALAMGPNDRGPYGPPSDAAPAAIKAHRERLERERQQHANRENMSHQRFRGAGMGGGSSRGGY